MGFILKLQEHSTDSQSLPASLCFQHFWLDQAAVQTHNGRYGRSCCATPPLACPLTFSRSGIYIRGWWGEGPCQPKWSLWRLCAACCLCWPCLLQVKHFSFFCLLLDAFGFSGSYWSRFLYCMSCWDLEWFSNKGTTESSIPLVSSSFM